MTSSGGTFSGNITVNNSNPILYLQGATADKNETHTDTSRFAGVGFYDKNGSALKNRVAVVRAGFAGSVDGCLAEFLAYSPDGSSESGIQVIYPRTGKGTPYAMAPSTPAGSVDNQIVTADYLNNTISGMVVDSFNGNLVLTSTGTNNAYVGIQNNAVTVEALPSSSRLTGIKMLDITGTTIGQCRTSIAKDGATNTSVIVYSPDGTKNGSIAINYTTAGRFVGTAPTPAAESDTTHIATTGWVRDFTFNGATADAERSVHVPPMLDNSMVTLLFDGGENGLDTGDITLSQPYTNFKALCVLFSGDDAKQHVSSRVISVWELEQRKAAGTTFSIIYERIYWDCNSTTSTTTKLVHSKNDGRIYKIWGIK
jgi:hypothetical protein